MSKGRSTVVHILTPSSAASLKFLDHLASLFHWEPLHDDDNNNSTSSQADGPWKQVFGSSNGLFSTKWHSTALQCPQTKTILQWIAVDHSQEFPKAPSALLGIQLSPSLIDAQNTLAQAIQSTRSTSQIALRSTMGKAISAHHLLGKHALPVLGFGGHDEENSNPSDEESSSSPLSTIHHANNSLKEISLPFFLEATNGAGLNVMDQLGQSGWRRPVPGLYQSPVGGLCIRPLPAATQDQNLSPPSIVFHCSSLEEWKEQTMSKMETTTEFGDLKVAQIGKTGIHQGQLLLRHPDWQGMDIRVCEKTAHSSMFAEAQESLLAASLPELQSSHVLEGAKGTVDPKTERMDCWAEFRATVRNPRGFLKRNEVIVTKTAKAPDLPYE